MKIPPVKGTRDFYPPDMAVRNFIIDGWKKVSLRNGFEEYDGPIFEYLKMFQIKSGDEIAEQLFSLKDRGGRELALRPEITPTLARMVNQQISSLPRPIKWFSVPRLFRAERPQRGRLREFFQWNIDIIGVEDVLADAEVIFTTIDYLRSVGLTKKDVRVKISSRKLLAEFLKKIGVNEKRFEPLYLLLDKYSKIPKETFEKLLEEQVPDVDLISKICSFMETRKVSDIKAVVPDTDYVRDALDEIVLLFDNLDRMNVGKFCEFDASIIRGLAYYTGIVFEVLDAKGDLRAICGGGRFDNLLSDFGGPEIPATGMGMGDCVLEVLLRQKDLLPDGLDSKQLDYFIAYVPVITFDNKDGTVRTTPEDEAVALTANLRSKGFSTEFTYKGIGLAKQLKEASDKNAKKCIIIGEEFNAGKLVVKDMATGKQDLIDLDKFLAQVKSKSK